MYHVQVIGKSILCEKHDQAKSIIKNLKILFQGLILILINIVATKSKDMYMAPLLCGEGFSSVVEPGVSVSLSQRRDESLVQPT